MVELPPANYMNDMAIPLDAASPVELFGRLQLVADLFGSVCRKHSLMVNFAAGKTEVIVRLAAPGTAAGLAFVEQLPAVDGIAGEGRVPLLPLSGGASLRLVSHYRHLGGNGLGPGDRGPSGSWSRGHF